MKEPWRQRQDQWKRFRIWEAQHRAVELSPEERLAEIGALVDLAQPVRQAQGSAAEDVEAEIQGIRVMRKRLAVLSRTI